MQFALNYFSLCPKTFWSKQEIFFSIILLTSVFSSQPTTSTKRKRKKQHVLDAQHLMTLKNKTLQPPVGKSGEIKETIQVCIHLSAAPCLALSGLMLQELPVAVMLSKPSIRPAESSKQKSHCTALSAVSMAWNCQKSPENENRVLYI